jgi:phytoene dehydrogenase-like protein
VPDVDAVVIGAGHNGLVCAAYLARAGLRTLLVEARSSVGGCASSESFGGATVNICNCDHITFRTTPVMDELDLGAHGLRYLEVDPGQLSMPAPGDSGAVRPAWPVFHDVERTIEGLRLLYPEQADAYRQYAAQAVPALKLILAAATEPPSTRRLVSLGARHARAASTIMRWSKRSAAAILREFFDDDAIIAPALATGPVVWGVSPEMPGTGLGALTLAMRHAARIGRPVGGSGMVPSALLASFTAHGGVTRLSTRVASIVCDETRVRGVELADGSTVEAPIVVSACDPHATLLSWLRKPPPAADHMVQRWRAIPQYQGYESKIDAVISAPPRYRSVDMAVADRLGFDPLHPSAMIAPTVAAIVDGHLRSERGLVMDQPVFFANVPSVLDPSMAPTGHHVFSLEALYTPYNLPGGWPDSNEPRRWLERYATMVEPGFLDTIVEWRAMTPDRYEQEFHMPLGHATSFAGGPLAALRNRNPELTRYETDVPGLFLTGAATFPGAGVWGASGRNCATVVIDRNG